MSAAGREHHAAFAIEVAGHDVDRLDEPAQRRGRTRSGRCPRVRTPPPAAPPWQLARKASDRSRLRCRRAGATARGENRAATDASTAAPEAHLVEGARVDSVFEQHVQEREQQRRVRAGADEVMLIALGRGLGTARIEEHDPAAAFANPLDPPRTSPSDIMLPLDAAGLAPRMRR